LAAVCDVRWRTDEALLFLALTRSDIIPHAGIASACRSTPTSATPRRERTVLRMSAVEGVFMGRQSIILATQLRSIPVAPGFSE